LFSTTHLLIVGVIVLLLFGNRLPSVMRSLGGSLREFKRGMDDVQRDVRQSIASAKSTVDDSMPRLEGPKPGIDEAQHEAAPKYEAASSYEAPKYEPPQENAASTVQTHQPG